MRIAIDARAYSWAGVGRYTRNLLKQLANLPSEHEFVVLAGERDRTRLREDIGGKGSDRFKVMAVDASYYSWREQTRLPLQLMRVEADLFHFTHFNVPLFFNRPYVVTIHDVTRFVFPGQTQQGLFKQLAYERVFKHAVERARGVMCVSETTRQDLMSLPLRLPSITRTIYEGVDRDFVVVASDEAGRQVCKLLATADPYLLYVGVWMNHKNLPRLLRAFTRLRERHPRLKLALTGKPKPGYVDVPQMARELGLGRDSVVYLGFVPRRLLPALYAGASCLVLPSLYEGFGLPALEAASSGTPVVASNVSSLPEIMGEAAEFVNPEYEMGMAAGLERVLSDAARREQLMAEGRRRARRFSWEKCALETLSVYAEAG